MADGTQALAEALERFDRAEQVDPLVSALGLVPERVRLDPERLPDGLHPGVVPAEAWSLVERDGLYVLLLVCDGAVPPSAAAEVARHLASRDPTRLHLLILCPSSFETVTVSAAGLDGEARHLTVERRRPLATDLEALTEMVAGPGEGVSALAARYARALDRGRVTGRFFQDFRGRRERVAHAWTGVPAEATAERMALALLFLCRLLFLHLLQRLGHLAGDPEYMGNRWRAWQRRRPRGSRTFFRAVLQPLFFGALNTRPEQRAREARALGDLPYLNGGLFERSGVERSVPGLDLPDGATSAVFTDLFERYRFTATESDGRSPPGTPGPGIDPGMLGRVFEGLMAPDQRVRTGTFFTPPHVVEALTEATLEAYLGSRCGLDPRDVDPYLRPGVRPSVRSFGEVRPDGRAGSALLAAARGIRVLDPACGSGAFLLGALGRLAALRCALGEREDDARRAIVAESLHGVDLQADAALLCSLRLWLALTLPAAAGTRPVAPLPNLDRRVRQGDALLDPLDIAFPDALILAPSARAALQREIAAIAPVARRYLASDPGERERLQRELRGCEQRLAERWIEGWTAAAQAERRSLELRAAQRDLWGEPTDDARVARQGSETLAARTREIERIASALHESGALPFFSFPVHFPEAALSGFDVVLMNPPWVRAHRWPAALRGIVRRRYAVCRQHGWSAPASAGRPAPAGQVDLAMLFLERALGLLAPGGALGALLPAKMLRSLYAGPARRLLMESMRLSSIEDYSLDQRALFEADAFAATIVAVRKDPAVAVPAERARVAVTMRRPGREALRFDVDPEDLPLVAGDPASPWLLAPPGVRSALRRMQAAGVPLGRVIRGGIRRGVETGANAVLVVREVEPRLGGLCSIRAEGATPARSDAAQGKRPSRRGNGLGTADFEATIEDRVLLPLVRGADLAAWTFEVNRHLIRPRAASGRPVEACPRARRYLERHASRWRGGSPRGRTPPGNGGARVAWNDLARALRAVVLPGTVRTVFGDQRPLVPLNTVYWLDAEEEAAALRLAGFLNSTPARVFAAAIAERAKDAHFRFFTWTISLLPAPALLRGGPGSRRLTQISERAHADAAIRDADQEELDDLVAAALGLDRSECLALAAFERWLQAGRP